MHECVHVSNPHVCMLRSIMFVCAFVYLCACICCVYCVCMCVLELVDLWNEAVMQSGCAGSNAADS